MGESGFCGGLSGGYGGFIIEGGGRVGLRAPGNALWSGKGDTNKTEMCQKIVHDNTI